MKKELICIICPRGCTLTVDTDSTPVSVSGNACKRGEQYGRDEILNPTRTVTSIVRVSNREDTMVSVKTSCPIPKENIFDVMENIHAASVDAPVKIGDVIIHDLFGADVITTKDII
jgi:CxxC motif-containing protein